MNQRDVISWNAMIAAYSQHGYGKEALDLFHRMQQEGVNPDDITLISVLNACSHVGLVDEGLHIFDSMKNHNVTPTIQHFTCVVDLLGRAGRLDDAENLIHKMPFQPDSVTWMTLLGACRGHNDVNRAKHVAEHILELDPQDPSGYVLLSNIYASSGQWNEQLNVRKMMKDRGVKKKPGQSWIEINGKIHSFIVADESHEEITKIHSKLDEIYGRMKNIGFKSDTSFVLHDVEDEEKEQHLCHHSEKLAIGFGLINTPPGTRLHVFKNLRVCGDCHSVTKLISQLEQREIIVRDTNRFHHFKDGKCSCQDYW